MSHRRSYDDRRPNSQAAIAGEAGSRCGIGPALRPS